MSFVDAMAVAAAERVEAGMGAAAALPTYRALARRIAPGETRLRALRGLFRSALRARKANEIQAFCDAWATPQGGDHLDFVIDTCKALQAAREPTVAAELAAAEVERHRTARALYLLGRCLERIDPARASPVFEQASVRGAKEGADDVVLAARARSAELSIDGGRRTAQDGGFGEHAVELPADLRRAAPRDVIAICKAQLRAPSRFARASAIAALEDVARRADAGIADDAVRAGARHADERGDRLTPLEADRLVSLLRLWHDPHEAEGALSRLAALRAIAAAEGREKEDAIAAAIVAAPEIASGVGRARAVLASQPVSPASAEDLSGLGVDLVAALRRDRAREATAALVVLRAAARGVGEIPPSVWTGVILATRGETRAAALSTAEQLLDTARTAPPRGYASLANALLSADRPDLAVRALRAAHAWREPRASEALARELTIEAWRRANAGDREIAVKLLREARAVDAAATPAKSTLR